MYLKCTIVHIKKLKYSSGRFNDCYRDQNGRVNSTNFTNLTEKRKGDECKQDTGN